MARQEQIYTIPVNDAFNQTERCPICELRRKQEENLVEFYLGPSLMEADHRLQTNEKGFCSNHLTMLYNSQINRLGLGLMLHTHLEDVTGDLERTLAKATPHKSAGIFGRKSDWKESLTSAAAELRKRVDSCVICERLEATLARYLDVIFWEYTQDEAFRKKFREGQGFCLEHTADLMEGASKHLNQREAEGFLNDLAVLQNGKFKEITGDVEWFTLKFDYRNQNEPWKNSKDALPRAIRRLEGDSDLK